jgi:hypothetical protein
MEHRFLAVGLPKAGKTTFIIALWHTLDTQSVPGSLVLDNVEGNLEYLESLRARWLQGLELGRTHTGSEQMVRMHVRDPEGETRAELALPDLAGETYQNQWLDRQWGNMFAEVASRADGLLVFVHPRYTFKPIPIADVFVPELVEQLVDGVASGQVAAEENESPEGVQHWDPLEAPTSVQLVEVLQFLQRAALDVESPVPTAVLVSAWDTIEGRGSRIPTPEEWVAEQLPLLHQFLRANGGTFCTRYYGVSAQGGDIATDRHRILEVDEPTDRITVVDPSGRSNDLTRPIRWLMNLHEKSRGPDLGR